VRQEEGLEACGVEPDCGKVEKFLHQQTPNTQLLLAFIYRLHHVIAEQQYQLD
jgi:hypothetical protein